MKRLNPETGKEFECGDTREYDPLGKGRLIFRGYNAKINKEGFFYEIWETPEKFWGRVQERKEYITKYTLDPVNRAKYIWNRTKLSAKRRKIGFFLVPEDVIPALERGICQMTGFEFVLGKPPEGVSTHPYAPSIDRIDSNKDYTKDNIRVVLWAVNAATNQFTDKEMLPILKAMVAAMEKDAQQKSITSIPADLSEPSQINSQSWLIPAAGTGQDSDNAHHHCGTISWEDINHRAQESSGDGVGQRGKEVVPSITLTRIENHGDAEPEIIRLDFGSRHLPD